MYFPPVQLLVFGVLFGSLTSYGIGNECHSVCDENDWCTDVCLGDEHQQQKREYQGTYNQDIGFFLDPEPEPEYLQPEPEYPNSNFDVPQPEIQSDNSYADAVEPMPDPPQPLYTPDATLSACHLYKAPCQSGGVCKPLCAGDEETLGRCPGLSCFCCKPKPVCVALETECSEGGVCRCNCKEDEVVVGSCLGIDCKCCSTNKKSKKE